MGTSLLGTDDGTGWGVRGDSETGVGVEANSSGNAAVRANSTTSNGIETTGGDAGVLAFGGNFGVKGNGTTIGVRGESSEGKAGSFENTSGDNSNPVIEVHSNGTGTGIQLTTNSGNGIETTTTSSFAENETPLFGNGVVVNTTGGNGLVVNTTQGIAPDGTIQQYGEGILVNTTGGTAISATSSFGMGLIANTSNIAIQGNSDGNVGVDGFSGPGPGVQGRSPFGTGVLAAGGTIGLQAFGGGALPTDGPPPEGFSAGVFANGGESVGVWTQSDTGIALVVNGRMQILGNAVGQATLPRDQTSVIVSTPAATPTSNVLLTPLDNPRGQLWVTRAAGSFTIHRSAASRADLPITYLIIN